MIILKLAKDLAAYIHSRGKEGASIGFVPTMGALHAGHTSLIDRCRSQCTKTVVSIFVNPTQFNNAEDFARYPVTLEKDILLLGNHQPDVIFIPAASEIYNDQAESTHYDLGGLELLLEGKYRPGHFQGVCQVVDRLLKIIRPTHLFLGQKDYQQCLVIKKLLTDIPFPVKLVISPTLRESDGLAMSSRNLRLTAPQRIQAGSIYLSLLFLKENLLPGKLNKVKQGAKEILEKVGFKVDYVEICDPVNLQQVEEWDGKKPLIALIAAYVEEVRLIDNLLLT